MCWKKKKLKKKNMKKLPSLDLFWWILILDHHSRIQKIMTPKSHFLDHRHHPLFPQEEYPTKSFNAYVIFHKVKHDIKKSWSNKKFDSFKIWSKLVTHRLICQFWISLSAKFKNSHRIRNLVSQYLWQCISILVLFAKYNPS